MDGCWVHRHCAKLLFPEVQKRWCADSCQRFGSNIRIKKEKKLARSNRNMAWSERAQEGKTTKIQNQTKSQKLQIRQLRTPPTNLPEAYASSKRTLSNPSLLHTGVTQARLGDLGVLTGASTVANCAIPPDSVIPLLSYPCRKSWRYLA